ncbi:MAG: hypothetical protein JXB10_15770 [Pirellulales bacterium]|nr:hypothetical protein [Pirellulales bacterium]
MRSVIFWRLGIVVILFDLMSVGLAEILADEKPPLPLPKVEAESLGKIVNPMKTFESEQHPVISYAPVTTPCTKPVLTSAKSVYPTRTREVVNAKAEEPVVEREPELRDSGVPEPLPLGGKESPPVEKPIPTRAEVVTPEPVAVPLAEASPSESPTAPQAITPSPESPAAAPQAKASPSANPPAAETLTPIPEADLSGPVPLEVVSFKGVTPNVSTIEDVEKAWGSPKEIYRRNDLMTQLYSVEPFDQVEVSYHKEKVSAIVVRFSRALPADKVARQLGLSIIRPVLVSNDMGEILGQVYPERGVLLAFEPSLMKSVPSKKVTHVILEPIEAEAFVLRAETDLSTRYEPCLKDLEVALKLNPDSARANWLAARVLAAMEQFRKARAAGAEAVRLEPDNPRYRLTQAEILGQMGRVGEALVEVHKALETSQELPHVQARALCLLGDLTASGPKPDYRQALAYHTQALKAADRAADNPHPAIRVAAKEVLVDAHLGAAHDIAWGEWKEKEKAIRRWVDRAIRFADDLAQNEGGSVDQQFRVYARALAAVVNVPQGIDPQPWIEEAVRTGRQRIDAAADPLRKAQCQWDLGLALYDAVQIYQTNSEPDSAFKYGQSAVTYLKAGYERKQKPESAYLLGRLYFRMGAICALTDEDHAAAVAWFDKATPLLMKSLHTENVPSDLGRRGETFVSMAVSYWESGQQKKAQELTDRGIKLMRQAVQKGTLPRTALAVPYSNLASMHRRQGAAEDAEKFQQMAARAKETKVK